VDPDPGQPGQPGRGGEHARRDEPPGADAGQQHNVGQVGTDDDRPGHGQEGKPGRDRAEAQGLLQVVSEEQEDTEHAGAGDEDRQVGAGPVAVGDNPQRQQRLAGPRLEIAERRQQHRARGQETPRRWRVPAVTGRVGEAVDDAEHAGNFGGEAGQVQPWPGPGWLPAQQRHRASAGDDSENEVDV
jgi:hypothetical protein